MNAVIYARYTLGAQTNPSLETQLKACREFAKANHYTVIGEYVDANSPGVRDRHHEFKRIIEDSVKQEFQAVLVCFKWIGLPANFGNILISRQHYKATMSKLFAWMKSYKIPFSKV